MRGMRVVHSTTQPLQPATPAEKEKPAGIYLQFTATSAKCRYIRSDANSITTHTTKKSNCNSMESNLSSLIYHIPILNSNRATGTAVMVIPF